MRKTILLVALLSLTACGDSNQADESEQVAEPDQTVIELENSDEMDEMDKTAEIDYFKQNPDINSEIYREFFSTRRLLEENSMESDVVGDNQVAEGNLMPIGTDNLSAPRYMDYTFNLSEEKLDLALILTEGTIVKEKELTEDVFVHLEYDKTNDNQISIIQENTNGDTVDHVNLTEEEWIEVAERSIEFVDRVQSH